MQHRSSLSLAVWVALAAQLSGCAAGRVHVLSRIPVQVETKEAHCATVTSADFVPDWPLTAVYPYSAERCEQVTTTEWEVTSRTETSDLARGASAILGGVGVNGLAYLLLTANQGDRSLQVHSAVETMVGTAVAVGTSFLGAGAGFGLLKLYEHFNVKQAREVESADLIPLERGRHRVDGVLQLPGSALSTRNGKLELSGAALLALDPQRLQLSGAPLVLDVKQQQDLAIAQACARVLGRPLGAVAELETRALTAALADAKQCFEGGVTAADNTYSGLLTEQMHRRMGSHSPHR